MRLTSGVFVHMFSFGMLFTASVALGANISAHAPIFIRSDADFTTKCACVKSGLGTMTDPYIIGPLSIIDGTNLTKSFVLLNLTVAGNGSATGRGIVLQNINNPTGTQAKPIGATVKGTQTSIQTANIGILVENSSHVTLDGGIHASNIRR